MAEILLAAGAAYLGYKAAKRVHRAYVGARSEMYAEQMSSYHPSQMHHNRSGYHHSNGYGGYPNVYAYGYR
jgi:hypothetical protein